jgi:hypothetical protein
MTEQGTEAEEAAAPEMPPELEIEFRGRRMWTRLPKPEQILVWKRTLRQLQDADVEGWNAEQVMNALERTRRIIDSVLVNSEDVTWLDDEMLDGRIDLRGTAEIIQMTVEAYAEAAEREKAENGTRAERRAAKKTTGKKARKAPTKKAAR